MDINKIRKAPYNPRKMSAASKKALKKSLDEFEDISGITINERSGNIVGGNHRWELLVKKFGRENLSTQELSEGFYLLKANNKSTGFLIRVVDWDLDKEKSANITANSDLISGEFTADLQNVLEDLSLSVDSEIFNELRLSDLKIDFDTFDDDIDLEDDSIVDKAQKKKKLLKASDNSESVDTIETRSTIRISLDTDLRDEVKLIIENALKSKNYYKDITIV
jgi:hypothetical protein